MDNKSSIHKKIVIVGGGSAGWMTASFFSKIFNTSKSGAVSITLVESISKPPVGVGEATIQSIRNFLQLLDIPEGDFILKTNATFKHGILFKNWSSKDNKNDQYFHPFETSAPLSSELQSCHYLNVKNFLGQTERYDRWHGAQSILAAGFKSPKGMQDPDYMGNVPYGYHFDAKLFSDYLSEYSISKGVTRIVSEVVDVVVDGNEKIKEIVTSTGIISGDLFIDCSGFSSILISKIGGEFLDYSSTLPCNRAVTCHKIHGGNFQPRPFTTATARTAGWTFEIDLFNRSGLGYVYSSKHISDKDAELEFKSAFDLDASTRINKFDTKIGRQANPWIGNCIAIGLSQGFIEPLESTGLYFIEVSLRHLANLLEFNSEFGLSSQKFNALINSIFDEAADFVLLHYKLSARRDSLFWEQIVKTDFINAKMNSLLELWSQRPPCGSDFAGSAFVYSESSFTSILYGMNFYTKTPYRMNGLGTESSLDVKMRLEKIQKSALSGSIDHLKILSKLRSAFIM